MVRVLVPFKQLHCDWKGTHLKPRQPWLLQNHTERICFKVSSTRSRWQQSKISQAYQIQANHYVDWPSWESQHVLLHTYFHNEVHWEQCGIICNKKNDISSWEHKPFQSFKSNEIYISLVTLYCFSLITLWMCSNSTLYTPNPFNTAWITKLRFSIVQLILSWWWQ